MPHVTAEQLDEIAFAIWAQDFTGPHERDAMAKAEEMDRSDHERLRASWPDWAERPRHLAKAAAAAMALGYTVPDGMAPRDAAGESRRRWDRVRELAASGPGRPEYRSGPTPPDQQR